MNAPTLPAQLLGAPHPNKSKARIAIEAVLQTAGPLSTREIARRTQLPVLRVHIVMNTLRQAGRIHRSPAREPDTNALQFGWGEEAPGQPAELAPAPGTAARGPMPAPSPEPAPAPVPPRQIRRLNAPGNYDGAELRPYTGRPGAMGAFALPSNVNGRRVERRAPMILASSAVEATRKQK